ncbi:MAG: 30S ribosomal protein S4 [Thermoplasmata archaeon]|nr:30S ribosomal protein S4 [Thermoplasmata archaeon]
MGDPKFARKKYETPSHPWDKDRIEAENALIKKYGLKNKREIWRAQTMLRKFRAQARSLLGKVTSSDPQVKRETEQLLGRLHRLGILPENATLDDVLALDVESILKRRLQTIVYLKGLASTPFQARQFIVHGHICIDNRRVTAPGYMVLKKEENMIEYHPSSPLTDSTHPARPSIEFAVRKKETVTVEDKGDEVKEV